ncbi:MAG: disulfide bond formation protein B [Bacteroidota bacterium]
MEQKGLYIANSAAMLMVSTALVGALFFQFGLHENPCPLCLLQRMGMFGVILGLGFNTYFGFRKEHFGLVIIGALVGVTISIRQILLHICPVAGEATGYGEPVFGMHLYSWGVIIFTLSIIGSVVFLFLTKDEKPSTKRTPLTFEKLTMYFMMLLVFINIVATFFECHIGPCCDNGPCP